MLLHIDITTSYFIGIVQTSVLFWQALTHKSPFQKRCYWWSLPGTVIAQGAIRERAAMDNAALMDSLNLMRSGKPNPTIS